MGWLFMHRDPRRDGTVADYFKRQFEYEGSKWRLIDSALVARTEFYGAIECIDGDDKGKVTAIICLVRFCRGEFNFGYKDMSEESGPYVYRCPKRILDRLTPTTHEYALKWRAACRAYQEKPRPKPGQTIVFAEPLQFTNGMTLGRFRYVKGSRFQAIHQTGLGGMYRITGWKDRAYTVATA